MRGLQLSELRRKRRNFRKNRKLCQECGRRNALYVRKVQRKKKGILRLGKMVIVKTDKSHDLCSQCRRALGNSFYTRPERFLRKTNLKRR